MRNVNISKRRFVQVAISVLALAALPVKLFARATTAFGANSAENVYQALFGNRLVSENPELRMKIPDIAENGAVVPVTLSTDIEGVESMYIIVDKNPNPLSVSFHMGPTSVSEISVRIKMAESSVVRGLVKTKSNVYSTSKLVKVTIGGCGG
jgi:sulfur-oxidizing protein SoxY